MHNAYSPEARRYSAWLARVREVLEENGLAWNDYRSEEWSRHFNYGLTPEQAARGVVNARDRK